MLPASYQLPAAVVLLLGGIVACFFGYRFFRLVLAIVGFILGALSASSVFGPSDTLGMVGAALVGGLTGALVLIGAYFLGVALVGAALGSVAAHVLFAASGLDPHFIAIIFSAVVGAVASMYLQRYVLIAGTGFGGALMLLHGGLALAGARLPGMPPVGNGVWLPYPLDPAPGQPWVPVAWLVLGAVGAGVQFGWTGGEKGRVRRRRKKSG
jgi:hypothetical protein